VLFSFTEEEVKFVGMIPGAEQSLVRAKRFRAAVPAYDFERLLKREDRGN